MRRWETLTALAAVILASAGALPIRGRLALTLAGVLLIAVVGASRLAAGLSKTGNRSGSDAAQRAQRIRDERERRQRR